VQRGVKRPLAREQIAASDRFAPGQIERQIEQEHLFDAVQRVAHHWAGRDRVRRQRDRLFPCRENRAIQPNQPGAQRRLDRRERGVGAPQRRLERRAIRPGLRLEARSDQQGRVGARDREVQRLGTPIIVNSGRAGGHRVRLVELPRQRAAVLILAAAVGLDCVAHALRLQVLRALDQLVERLDLTKRLAPLLGLDPPRAAVKPDRVVERHRPAIGGAQRVLQRAAVRDAFRPEFAVQQRRRTVVERLLRGQPLMLPGAVHVMLAERIALDLVQVI